VETGVYADAVNPTTRADSISVTCPSNAHGARRAILESEGLTLTVTDAEILQAQATLARGTGIFTEPAGAAALAGLVKLQQTSRALPASARTVLLATGNGLKDVEAPLSLISIPSAIEPRLESVPV
jgi:threonine synthase